MNDRLAGLILVAAAVFAMFPGNVEPVFANGGPHEGTFTVTTGACAGCHRTHTALSSNLLMAESQYALCISCHDGTGADTKVTTGVYLGTTRGTRNAGLKGGGFEQALMNTAVSATFNQIGSPSNVTSRHSAGSTGLIAWGSNLTGVGESVNLECTNCHNPHGNYNYRMLRGQPTSLPGWDNLTAVNITAGVGDAYTIRYNIANYRDLRTGYSGGVISSIGDWCTQCHTRYKAGRGTGSNISAGGTPPDNWPAGTSPYLYRHPTIKVASNIDAECSTCHWGTSVKINNCTTLCHTTMPSGDFPNPTRVPPHMTGECLTCHVAHGSSAFMTGNAAGPSWPDGNATQPWQTGNEGQHSRLLTIDNRGVCLQCHISNYLTRN